MMHHHFVVLNEVKNLFSCRLLGEILYYVQNDNIDPNDSIL